MHQQTPSVSKFKFPSHRLSQSPVTLTTLRLISLPNCAHPKIAPLLPLPFSLFNPFSYFNPKPRRFLLPRLILCCSSILPFSDWYDMVWSDLIWGNLGFLKCGFRIQNSESCSRSILVLFLFLVSFGGKNG